MRNDKRKCWINLVSTLSLHLCVNKSVFVNPISKQEACLNKCVFAEESDMLKV